MADKRTRTAAGRKVAAKPEAVGEDGLTDKQRVFVEQYLACLNLTEAARRAGYSEKSARQIGSENRTKPYIAQLINQGFRDRAMPADEVIARLSEQATADMADFLSVSGRGVRLDLKRARELGKLHLVRKFSKTKQGTSIELVDVQGALVQLGRHHALFTDNVSGKFDVTRRDKSAEEMSDDELAAIAANVSDAAGGRAGDTATPASA